MHIWQLHRVTVYPSACFRLLWKNTQLTLQMLTSKYLYPQSQSQKLWHFHKNIRSCVENEWCCPRTVNISNVNFTLQKSIPPEPAFKSMGQQMSGPDSSNGKSIWHESEGWGARVPLRSRHFLSQKLWHFHKNIRSCVENECCSRAQLTFQMLTLLQKQLPRMNLYRSACLRLLWKNTLSAM